MISTKNKMIFSNSFGCFNKDQVVVNKSNYDLVFKEIASIKIKKKKSFVYEIIYIVMTAVLFSLLFFDVNEILIMLISLGLLFFTIIYLFMLKKDVFYIQIILCVPKQLFIGVKRSEYESAKEFTNTFTSYRQFYTDL
ncbi:hypothetical protein [Flavobacterium sp.]|uniref:hypothetical protein n=1 Tax=Flavobacterium sp. TaxID=239 RepID=UPI000ED8F9A6|nr:hypothetical protein [Flavobacterium sp.]HCQ13879.1 hypothetical protein [Flavobacterium sp.]